jgi:hypothetical protein
MKKIIALVLLTLTLVFTSACSCKKEETLTREQYSKAYESLAEILMKKEEITLLGYVDSSESSDRGYLTLGVYALFLEEVVKNENFTAINGGVGTITSTARFYAINEIQELEMNATVKIECEDGKIRTDFLEVSASGDEMHLIIDIVYDFENSKLTSFDLMVKYEVLDEELFNHYKGNGESIQVLEEDEDEERIAAINFIASRRNSLNEHLDSAKDIGDYSTEYSTAMIEHMNFIYGEGFATPVE